MKKDNKQKKKRERVQIKFNTGQRVHKSKKDYKRNNKVDIPNNKKEWFNIRSKYSEILICAAEGECFILPAEGE